MPSNTTLFIPDQIWLTFVEIQHRFYKFPYKDFLSPIRNDFKYLCDLRVQKSKILKTQLSHANFVINDDTTGCHNNNMQYHL